MINAIFWPELLIHVIFCLLDFFFFSNKNLIVKYQFLKRILVIQKERFSIIILLRNLDVSNLNVFSL